MKHFNQTSQYIIFKNKGSNLYKFLTHETGRNFDFLVFNMYLQ